METCQSEDLVPSDENRQAFVVGDGFGDGDDFVCDAGLGRHCHRICNLVVEYLDEWCESEIRRRLTGYLCCAGA